MGKSKLEGNDFLEKKYGGKEEVEGKGHSTYPFWKKNKGGQKK